MNSIENQLRKLQISNLLAFLFIIASIMSFYGNKKFKDFLFTNKTEDEITSRRIIMIQLIFLLLIYLYITYQYYQDYLQAKASNKNVKLSELRLIGVSFLVLGTILLIYYQYKNPTISGGDPF